MGRTAKFFWKSLPIGWGKRRTIMSLSCALIPEPEKLEGRNYDGAATVGAGARQFAAWPVHHRPRRLVYFSADLTIFAASPSGTRSKCDGVMQ